MYQALYITAALLIARNPNPEQLYPLLIGETNVAHVRSIIAEYADAKTGDVLTAKLPALIATLETTVRRVDAGTADVQAETVINDGTIAEGVARFLAALNRAASRVPG